MPGEPIYNRRESPARILILSQYFPPEGFTAARRAAALAAAINSANPVTVSTLAPSYPRPAFYPPDAAAQVDARLGYRVLRSRPFRRHTRSRVLRAVREQVMAVRLGLEAARSPADVVIASSPSMFLGPVGWALARLKRALFVWDLRDLTWEFAAEATRPSSRTRVGLHLLRRCMWSISRRADLLTVATPGIAALVAERGIRTDAVVLLPNQAPPDVLDRFAPAAGTPARPPTVAYVGLIGEAQGLGVLVDVARHLPDVRFVVAGDGPQREDLEHRARETGATNLTFPGHVGREQVLEIYRNSDILFSHIKDTPTLNATAMPSKLLEYMATGKPLIHAGKGLAETQLDEIGCGIVIPPEDPAAIVAAIKTLVADRDEAKRLGERGRTWVTQSNGRAPVTELVQALNRRAANRRGVVTRLRSNTDASDPLAYMVARVAGAALTATTTVLVAASLSKSAYGTFAAVTAVAGALVVVADLGLTSSLARFIARGTADRALLVRVVLMRAALAAGAGGLLALYGAAVQAGWLGGSHAAEESSLLYLAGALVVANSFTALVTGLLPVFRSMRALMALTILQPLLELVGVAIVVALALEASGVMAAMVIAAALAGAVGVPIVVRRAFTVEEASSLMNVARYGGALAIVSISMALFGVVDLLAIGYFHDSEAVAPYALALKLIAVMQLPGLAIAAIVAPRLAEGGGRPLQLFEGWLGVLVAAYAGLVVIAAVLAPQGFAAIGSEYDGDSPLLLALAPYALLAGIAPLASMAANYLGGARRRLRLAFATLAVNIILDVLLVPPLGAYGAALATTIAFAWYVGGHLRLTCELLGGRPRLHVVPRVHRLGAALVVSATVAWLAAAPLDDRPWLALAIAGPAAVAAYALIAGAGARGLAEERPL